VARRLGTRLYRLILNSSASPTAYPTQIPTIIPTIKPAQEITKGVTSIVLAMFMSMTHQRNERPAIHNATVRLAFCFSVKCHNPCFACDKDMLRSLNLYAREWQWRPFAARTRKFCELRIKLMGWTPPDGI